METLPKRRQEITGTAHGREKAVWSPCPVANNWINEPGNRNAIKQVAHKAGSANHGSRSNRGTSVGKGKLEQPESKKRNARGLVRYRSTLQKEPVIADEPVAVTEHK